MGKRNQKEDREDISTDIAVSPFYGKLGHAEIQTISMHLHFLAERIFKEYIFENFGNKKSVENFFFFNLRQRVLTMFSNVHQQKTKKLTGNFEMKKKSSKIFNKQTQKMGRKKVASNKIFICHRIRNFSF